VPDTHGTGDVDPIFLGELTLPDDPAFDLAGLELYHAAAVRFEASRLVEHDSGDVSYARGDRVVCETGNGISWGEVVVPSRRVLLRTPPLRILRRATSGDLSTEAHLREREQAVWRIATDTARAQGLAVKVVRAEALNGGGRFVVYFASDAKLPFRDWLRGIGRGTRERVELRQIGMRDAARLIGGVGPCGLQLCCNTFLSDFTPVGIKMAKDQGLTLNPQKVSGMCGRLLCCLVYEEAQYRAGRKAMPEPGELVVTERGGGRVREVDVLQMKVSVVLDGGTTESFPAASVRRRSVE
jgi:cell fate regulator YaaT (PSP1 superfamily)